MTEVITFLEILIQQAISALPEFTVMPYGDGFAVGCNRTGWIQIVPPVKVTIKESRYFFDSCAGTVKVRLRQRRDGSDVLYVGVLQSAQSTDGYELEIQGNSVFSDWFRREVSSLHKEVSASIRQTRRYIRFASALGVLGLDDDFTAAQIVAAYKHAKEVAERFPPSASHLCGIVNRAQETLFAALKGKPDFDRGASYDDPIGIPSAWHAAKVLGVAEDESEPNVERAFLKIAKAVHPDRCGNRYLFQMAVKARDVMLAK